MSTHFRHQYLSLVPRLTTVLHEVQNKLLKLPPSDFLSEMNIKPFQSAKRKMEKRHLHDPTKLSDLVRGRLYFSDKYLFTDVQDMLKKMFASHIKNVDNKDTEKLGLEYHGVMHVDMEFDGINFELQVIPIEFKPYKEFLHQIYEKLRDHADRMSKEQAKRLQDIHNRLTSQLDEKAKADRHIKKWKIDNSNSHR